MEEDSIKQSFRWTPSHLDLLLQAVIAEGYTVIAPTVSDGVITLGAITNLADLPKGLTDDQEPGHYILRSRNDSAYFGYNLSPESWRRWLHPPSQSVWRATKVDTTWSLETEPRVQPKLAFLGVRACDLAAMKTQKRVEASFVSTSDQTAGQDVSPDPPLIIGVQCGQSSPVCFCASMDSGPGINEGCDIVMTELLKSDQESLFIVHAYTARGKQYACGIGGEPSPADDARVCDEIVKAARDGQTRSISIKDPVEFFRRSLESSYWQDVGARCLGCACCTLVCPTCFCTTTFDVTDLTATKTERVVVWDSCFNKEFTFIHGSCERDSIASRYRQWMSHKLGSWHEQFGSSGCVGCGRCITWCPVGIDITKEVATLAKAENLDSATT